MLRSYAAPEFGYGGRIFPYKNTFEASNNIFTAHPRAVGLCTETQTATQTTFQTLPFQIFGNFLFLSFLKNRGAVALLAPFPPELASMGPLKTDTFKN
jgi:hypothetical protein